MSGGPDSTALLAMLVEAGRPVVAATFDHALRPGSAADVDAVRAICDRLRVPVITGRRDRPMPPGSVQAGARLLRYEFLERAAEQAAADLIATAHTADDLVETVVMNILRGCGVRGLRGIPARRGRLVRPLLGVTRALVEEYLHATALAGLTVADPSNRDRRFARARVRHMLLPALSPVARDRLRRIALLAAAVPTDDSRGLSRTHRDAIARLLAQQRTGASLNLPGRVVFRVLPGGRPLFETSPAGQTTVTLQERACPGCSERAAVHVPEAAVVTIGHRTPGLRLRPRGGPGGRKLQDVLVDAKVPRHLRDGLPLVFVDGALAWVPTLAEDENLTLPRSEKGRHVWLEGLSEGDGIFGRQSPLEPQRGDL